MKCRFIQVAWGNDDEKKFVCEVKKHWWNEWKVVLNPNGLTRIYDYNDKETIVRTLTFH